MSYAIFGELFVSIHVLGQTGVGHTYVSGSLRVYKTKDTSVQMEGTISSSVESNCTSHRSHRTRHPGIPVAYPNWDIYFLFSLLFSRFSKPQRSRVGGDRPVILVLSNRKLRNYFEPQKGFFDLWVSR
jgi:hypothetical protein